MTARAPWLLVLATALTAAGMPAPSARAAEDRAVGSESEAPLRFRRVYVPSDRVGDWPRDQRRYLPVDPAEFERLAGLGAGRGASGLPAGLVAAAEYRAALRGGPVLEGEAVLEVVRPDGATGRLLLAPCNLAVAASVWAGEKPGPAPLSAGPDGKLEATADRSGPLRWTWSLRGRRDAAQSVEFAFELPVCPVTALRLELPKDLRPLVEGAAVEAEAGAPAGAVLWRCELGGRNRFRLRLVPAADADGSRSLDSVRQATVYDVSPRGVDVSAQWTLDVHNVPLRRLEVELDPGLELIWARYGQTPLAWSPVGAAKKGEKSVVVLDLPEPVRGAGRVVRLGALGPVELGRRWRLPEFRARGLFWREGTVRLLVPLPLVLEEVAASGARQTATGPMPPPRAGEAVDLQCHAPQADVDVALARPQAPLELDLGTAVELSGVEMTGRMVAQVRVAEGEQFLVRADVSPRWTVDSVESVPAGAVDDWTQEPAAGGLLTVRLAKAVLPDRPVRLMIAGHHLHAPLHRTLAASDLAPLRFHARSGRRLVSLVARDPNRLELNGAEGLARLDPQALTPADAELFAEPPRGLLFAQGTGDGGLRASLAVQQPSYSAQIQVEASIAGGTLTESYSIRCVPEATRVDRVLVRFSHARAAPLRWTLVGEESEPLAVRPAAPPGRPAPTQGESWEVAMRRPRSVPFEIRAVRSGPLTGPRAISLAALPRAKAQRGTLAVASSSAALQITNRDLTPVPAEPVPEDRYGGGRAAFSYDPVRDTADAREAAISIAPAEGSRALPGAWVWHCNLESRFEAEGAAHHLATFRIENAGREAIRISLPAGVSRDELGSVWVDGSKAEWTIAPGDDGREVVGVTLPPERRFPVVSVRFATAGPRLGLRRSLAPAVPEADVPVLSRDWMVLLPPGYQGADPRGEDAPWGCAAHSASQRLFGPLGRGDASDGTESTESDPRRPDRSDLVEPEEDRGVAGEFLLRVAKAEAALRQPAAPQAEGPPARVSAVSWGDLLGKAAEGWETRLLIDRHALARAGITAQTPAAPAPPQAPSARAAALLGQADLTVLTGGGALLVTTTLDAAVYRSLAGGPAQTGPWCAMSGPLAEAVREAADTGMDPCFVPAETWRRMPADPTAPWAAADLACRGPTDALGWAAHRLDLPDGADTRLVVVHRDWLVAAGWIAFAAVMALVGWAAGKRPAACVAAAGLLGVAALWSPDVYGPVVSGAFLGTLAGLAFAAAAKQVAARAASSRRAAPGQAAVPATVRVTALVLAALLGIEGAGFGRARAGEPAEAPLPGPPPAYRVLIPVGAQEKPTGEKCLVPEDLYNELQRRLEAAAAPRQPWRLTAAVYRGALAWQTAPERLAVGELKGIYDFQVTGRQVRIRVPLGEGARVAPAGAVLEGRAVSSIAPEGAAFFEFEAPEPGLYRLELPLRPALRTDKGATDFEIGIPPLATARLELSVPRDAPAVEVPSALGAVVRDADASRIVAQLGPCGQLAVRWPEGRGRLPEGPALDIEQLLWLKIQPGAVVLDATMKCRFVQGRTRRLEISADPRLRMAPLVGERPWLAQIETLPGSPQTLRLDLSPAVPEQFTVQASFLLTECTGVGRLRLPRMEPIDARVSRRWMAVSVDPALAHRQEGAGLLQAVAPLVFLSAWGEAKGEPLYAYNVPGPDPEWSISTSPLPARTAAEQTLAVGLGESGAAVRLDARLDTSPGLRFHYRILAPAELEVESVSVQEESGERAARWSRRQDGSVLVFLHGPASGTQTLTLRGRLPGSGPRSLALPLLRVEADETRKFLLHLYREPAVQVEVRKATGLVESDAPPDDQSAAVAGRLVGSFRAGGAEPPGMTLAVKPNRPEMRASQTTSLRTDGRTWHAEADYRITVSGGLVDELRLQVPANWPGPYQVSLPAGSKLNDAPAAGLRELVLRPRSALQGECRLRVSGPLELAPGELPGAPNIVLQQAETSPRLLVLPVQSELQPLAWETRGLARVDLPDEYPVPPAARESLAAYLVAREPFHAAVSTLGPLSGSPQVLLADVVIAWQSDSTCRGVAAFDLNPSGLAGCPLALPAPLRLMQVAVNGTATATLPDGPGQWKVPLPVSTLPQRLEVVFHGPLDPVGEEGLRRFPIPVLGDLPVRRTLWTVVGPPGLSAETSGGLDPIGRLDQEMIRLRSLTGVAELANDFPAEDPDAPRRWYAPWARRWTVSRNEAQRLLLSVEPSVAQTVQAEIDALARMQSQAAQGLKTAEALVQASAARPVATGPLEVARELTPCSDRAARGALDGTLRWVSLLVRPVGEAAGVSSPWLPSVEVVLLTAVVAWGLGRPRFREFFSRWPHVAGIVAGAAWWLWLQPAAVGAVLAAGSALWLAHALRRSRRGPRPSNTR